MTFILEGLCEVYVSTASTATVKRQNPQSLKVLWKWINFPANRENLLRPVEALTVLTLCYSRVTSILNFCRDLQCKTDLLSFDDMTVNYSTKILRAVSFPWLNLKVPFLNSMSPTACDNIRVTQKCYFLTAVVKKQIENQWEFWTIILNQQFPNAITCRNNTLIARKHP